MKNEKSKEELLKEQLFYTKKKAFKDATEGYKKDVFAYAQGYVDFLNASKTEREATATGIELAKTAGFIEYNLGDELKVGGKYYLNNRGKSLIAFKIGKKDLEKGVKICAAHIDSPRLDLKQHPLYESEELAYLKPHYYGGIRKYQWTTIPLALHGVVVKANGEKVNVVIGEDENDPVFCITDLLPHLAKDQSALPLATAINGEGLNLLIGSEPYGDVKDAVKLNVLRLLNEKYGITESDLISSEICAVPANKARDLGLDRSMILGYGHDDRVCAYPALTSLLDDDGDNTVITVLADKEEIGSEGVSGMRCKLLIDLLGEIAKAFGKDVAVIKSRSACLSADVSAGFDPLYPEVFEKNNSALMNAGVVMCKFTGSRGKSDSNDASAEFVGEIRRIFDGANVLWQTAELGKVDVGGGGTVAKYIAEHNIDTVDLGVPVLSMHAPLEVIAKTDLYETYKAFKAFAKS